MKFHENSGNFKKIKLLKIGFTVLFCNACNQKFHPFHSISYRFRDKHILHKKLFLHLQHNFIRQFKGELVHFVHLP